MNEYVGRLKLSSYEIVFSLFAKSEYRIQIIKHIWTETSGIASTKIWRGQKIWGGQNV